MDEEIKELPVESVEEVKETVETIEVQPPTNENNETIEAAIEPVEVVASDESTETVATEPIENTQEEVVAIDESEPVEIVDYDNVSETLENAPVQNEATEADSSNDLVESEPIVTKPKEKRPRKKFVFKKWMAVVAGVALVFLVTGLILGFIPHRALSDEKFDDWLFVNVFDARDPNSPMISISRDDLSTDNARRKDILQDGLNSTSYSVLRALLEFNFVNDLRFRVDEETEENVPVWGEDGHRLRDDQNELVYEDITRDVRFEVRAENVPLRTRTQQGTYLLEFIFATQGQPRRSLTVRDNSDEARENREREKTVYFDTIHILISDSFNSIEQFTMYAFDSERLNRVDPFEPPYYVSPIFIRMNTTTLYERLTDIREEIRGDRDNGTHISQITPDPDEPDYDYYV